MNSSKYYITTSCIPCNTYSYSYFNYHYNLSNVPLVYYLCIDECSCVGQ